MIKIYCLYFEGKYTPEYVNRLYRSIKRNCAVNTHFVCYSDTEVECDELIPLPKDTPIKAHWFKLQFFDKTFTGPGKIIVMDIDQVVVSDITDMITYPVGRNKLVSYQKWWSTPTTIINGGWYKFNAGDFQCVWDKYISDPEKWQLHYFNTGVVHYKYFGEQNFVQDTVLENGGQIVTMPGQWVAKITHDKDNNEKIQRQYVATFNQMYMFLGDEWNPNVKIVHFANPDNDIHNCSQEWIDRYWK